MDQCRQEIQTLGHESTADTLEDLPGRRRWPRGVHHLRNRLFNVLSPVLLHRSQMEEPSSRKSSPMMQCLTPITLTWRTTADAKTWCTSQQSGEPTPPSLLACVTPPWNDNASVDLVHVNFNRSLFILTFLFHQTLWIQMMVMLWH